MSFLRTADGVLITGDALVTVELNQPTRWLRRGLSEPPWYTTWDRRAARDSIRALAGRSVAVFLPGHGAPLVGAGAAARVRVFSDGLKPTTQTGIPDRVERSAATSRPGDAT